MYIRKSQLRLAEAPFTGSQPAAEQKQVVYYVGE